MKTYWDKLEVQLNGEVLTGRERLFVLFRWFRGEPLPSTEIFTFNRAVSTASVDWKGFPLDDAGNLRDEPAEPDRCQ